MITWYRNHRLHVMLVATCGMMAFGLSRFWVRLDALTVTVLVGGVIGLITNGLRALRSDQPEAVRQAIMACAIYCIMALGLVNASLK